MNWASALWVFNALAAGTIIICGVRVMVERSKAAPLWLRAANAAMVIGAAWTLSLDPSLLDTSQTTLNCGVAGTMIYRLYRHRAA